MEIFWKIIAGVITIMCVVLGALLLFWPNALLSANRISKKWVATDKLEEALNRTRDVDAQLMKMRLILGFVLALLALFFVVLIFK